MSNILPGDMRTGSRSIISFSGSMVFDISTFLLNRKCSKTGPSPSNRYGCMYKRLGGNGYLVNYQKQMLTIDFFTVALKSRNKMPL